MNGKWYGRPLEIEAEGLEKNVWYLIMFQSTQFKGNE